jgi:GNAT superfamily N-acetyltransferase
VSKKGHFEILVRQTKPDDFPGIIEITREVYPSSMPWTIEQLASHLSVFPEGQFVALDANSGRIAGVASSLIVLWDDYEMTAGWRDFTDHGMFTNHDPEHGRTLYGAEVMVRPSLQGRRIGSALYKQRKALAKGIGLLRIRAGARLRGYSLYAHEMSAATYVGKVIKGELRDPTLSFQLKHGFYVLAVVPNYLRHDPESLGFAAVIEWINEAVAKPEDYIKRDLNLSKGPFL